MATKFEKVMAEMEKVAAKSPAALAASIRATIADRRQAEEGRARVLAARATATTDRRMLVKTKMAAINREIAEIEQKTAAGKKAGMDPATAAALAKRTAELLEEVGRLREERDRSDKAALEQAKREDAAWMAAATKWAAEDAKVLHGR
jgi:hypothetical protein